MDEERSFLSLAFRPAKGRFLTVLSYVLPSGIVAAGALLAKQHGYWAAIGVFVFLAGLLLVGGLRAQRQWDRARAVWEAKQPRLLPDRLHVALTQLHSNELLTQASTGFVMGTQRRILPDHLECAYFDIRNDPRGRSKEAYVKDAVVSLAFYEPGASEPALRAKGRWSDNPQAAELAYDSGGPFNVPDHVRRRDLPPNGEAHRIDLVFRYLRDDALFVGSDDVWFKNARDPEAQLFGNEYLVQVIVRGVNLPTDAIWWIRIQIEDPDEHGDKIRLTYLPEGR